MQMNTSNKQTAVEWLVDELLSGKPLMPSLIEQAIEMEREQIVDAFHAEWSPHNGSGQQYYENTYGEEAGNE